MKNIPGNDENPMLLLKFKPASFIKYGNDTLVKIIEINIIKADITINCPICLFLICIIFNSPMKYKVNKI